MRRNNNSVEDIEDNVNNKSNKGNKSNKKAITMFIWLLVLIFTYYQVFMLVQYTLGKVDKSKMWLYNGVNAVFGLFVKEEADLSKTEEHTLTLATLGDVYATANSIAGAKKGSSYDFTTGTEKVKDVLSKYDVVLASLNTPITSGALSTKTSYNSPKQLAEMLKNIGVYAVATATDHIYDKSEKGITDTIASLDELGLKQIGINATSDKNKPLVISKNGINIGLLSYATSSNVKLSTTKTYLVNSLKVENVKSDVEYLKAQGVDFIVAYLSIPNKDTALVNGDQKNNVDMLFENGVNAVFGTGSLIVQNQSEDIYDLENGDKNHVYTIYSLGDFAGASDTTDRDISVIGDIKFTKTVVTDKKGNVVADKTKTNMIVNKPIGLWTKVSTNKSTTIYPIDSAIADYNNDKITLTVKEYDTLKTTKEKLNQMFK